jgi:hypothetical protein
LLWCTHTHTHTHTHTVGQNTGRVPKFSVLTTDGLVMALACALLSTHTHTHSLSLTHMPAAQTVSVTHTHTNCTHHTHTHIQTDWNDDGERVVLPVTSGDAGLMTGLWTLLGRRTGTRTLPCGECIAVVGGHIMFVCLCVCACRCMCVLCACVCVCVCVIIDTGVCMPCHAMPIMTHRIWRTGRLHWHDRFSL